MGKMFFDSRFKNSKIQRFEDSIPNRCALGTEGFEDSRIWILGLTWVGSFLGKAESLNFCEVINRAEN